jgi:4a-hydroxytetrahydrobiopterin dehydratase
MDSELSLAMEDCTSDNRKALLGEAEQQELLHKLDNTWIIKDGYLSKSYDLDNFKEATAFLNTIAAVAEFQHHHPILTIEYNKLHYKSRTEKTHETNLTGLTRCDFIIAAKLDQALRLMGKKNV